MSASHRLPFILRTLALVCIPAAPLLHPRSRSVILHAVPKPVSHLLLYLGLLLSLLLNLKAIPWSWHFRVLRAITHQLYLTHHSMHARDIFKPIVTTSWNGPLECDYNLHKSNSTYFADLDVSRAHYVGALIRTGLRRLNAGDRQGLPDYDLAPSTTSDAAAAQSCTVGAQIASDGRPRKASKQLKGNPYIIALGGVACTFRKEIKPLARFEIWTRLLSWDDKWIYIVSHVVKAGAVKPTGYSLQPWRADSQGQPLQGWSKMLPSWLGVSSSRRRRTTTSERARTQQNEPAATTAEAQADPLLNAARSSIYATSIAKYVLKQGRRTIEPEILLRRSRLIPEAPRPAHLGPLSLRTAPTAHSQPPRFPAHNPAELVVPSTTGSVPTLLPPASGTTFGAATPSSTALGGPEAGAVAALVHGAGITAASSAQAEDLSGKETQSAQSGIAASAWDGLNWEEIEHVRVRGLRYAAMFDGLAGLHDEFGQGAEGDKMEGGDMRVLGVYGEMLY